MLGLGKSYLMGKIVEQNLAAYNRVTCFQRTPRSRRAVLPYSSETLIGTSTFTGQAQTAYWVFTINSIQGRSTSVDTFPVLLGLDYFHNKVLVSADVTSGHNRFYLFVWGNSSCQYITVESGQLAKHPVWGPIWWAALC